MWEYLLFRLNTSRSFFSQTISLSDFNSILSYFPSPLFETVFFFTSFIVLLLLSSDSFSCGGEVIKFLFFCLRFLCVICFVDSNCIKKRLADLGSHECRTSCRYQTVRKKICKKTQKKTRNKTKNKQKLKKQNSDRRAKSSSSAPFNFPNQLKYTCKLSW